MQGQWVGQANGTNNIRICMNIDCINGALTGTLICIDHAPQLPSFVANIAVTQNGNDISFTGRNLTALHPKNHLPISHEEMATFHPDTHLPEKLEGSGTLDDKRFKGTWKTSIDTSGAFEIFGHIDQAKEVRVIPTNWAEFKEGLDYYRNKSHLFRGQKNSEWGLNTLFHRSGRSDLARYFKEDIPKLYRHIHAETGLKFDLADNNDLGALLYLAQHHGFPTPLLDWSYSPYVAAYFAFEKADSNGDGSARIYVLDKENWIDSTYQTPCFNSHDFTLSYAEFLTSGNRRAIPQQAVTTFSTLGWIEGWITFNEEKHENRFLTAYDIPVQEREMVMADLRLMGITQGSLFPGLDGICKELKDQYF
ncbi:MAG: FRG domain-containing protein [Motiliproteus sp.]